mmetsp:Transcript_9211/g.23029  ORF Transcript_9211/g.23029 Transcript_9211/m.23029 type:complete len:236 (+) Transcript_9211:202-909(+)
MVHHGLWVVDPHYALGLLLHVHGGGPRLVDVLGGHVLEHGQVVADERALLVVLLAERHRAIDPEVLVKEARARQPHPVAVVDGPVGVHQVAVEHLGARLPVHEQVAAGQEARHRVPRQVVHPPLGLQLRHARINPRKPRAPLLPGGQTLLVPCPGDLPAYAVALHAVIVGCTRGAQVIKLAPHDLPFEALGRLRVFAFQLWAVQHGPQFVIEGARGDAAKLEVGGQRRGGGGHEG